MLVNSAGGQEELTCFEREDTTDAWNSCFVNWQNELFVFGGYYERRQISRLSGHKLKRVGDLNFDLRGGACSIMQNTLYICFDHKDAKRCRRSTGPLDQFSEIALSTHDHQWIQTSCSNSEFFFYSSHSLWSK